MIDTQPRKPRLSLSALTLLGLALGVLTGLFLGELATNLEIVGQAYIRLLQMTVLPYIIVSLMANIGALTIAEARRLAVGLGLTLLGAWLISLLLVFLMTLSYPTLETASFFSTSILYSPDQVDYLELYIPTNPFESMANSVVPAVVLFSIFSGIALIGVERKGVILEQLTVLSETLLRVSTFIAKLTPIGVFSITAATAGTLTLAELDKIQAYIITYWSAALITVLLILPMLVASFTPFSYRSIFRHFKDPLIVGFSTGNVLIVLPLLINATEKLVDEYKLQKKEFLRTFRVVLPVVFTFPSATKILLLMFLPFAGWFSGNSIEGTEYFSLALTGLFSFFGAVSTAIVFLLDLFRIPADLFELYLATSVAVRNVAAIGAVMHITAVSLLAVCFSLGMWKLRKKILSATALTTALALAISVFGINLYLSGVLSDTYNKDDVIANMHLLKSPVEARVIANEDASEATGTKFLTTVSAIQERGVLRAGYAPEQLPWSFTNRAGQLVGFDVEMAHNLARDLNVGLEFVPYSFGTMFDQLNDGEFDIAFTMPPVTPGNLAKARFGTPHMDLTVALAVRDPDRARVSTLKDLQAWKGIRIGVFNDQYFVDLVADALPNAIIVPIDTPRRFFEDADVNVDAALISAEGGSAWTLLYPEFSVVVPEPINMRLPVAYAVAHDSESLHRYLVGWTELKMKEGTVKRLMDYWVFGKDAAPTQPRWSIIRDVLHWVE